MRVRLLRSVATAVRVYRVGDVVDLPPDLAARWAAEGVVHVEDPAELEKWLAEKEGQAAADSGQEAEPVAEGEDEGKDEGKDEAPQGEDAEAEAKAQAGPPETKAKEAPPEEKEAGVTGDGGSGDAGGGKGGAGRRSGGRRPASQAD